MTEVKDYNKLYKELYIRTHTLEILNHLPQDELTERLRKDLIDCKDGDQLIELSTEVLKLQLDFMDKRREQYPKYK